MRLVTTLATPPRWWRLWTMPTLPSSSASAGPPAIDAVVVGLHQDEGQALFGKDAGEGWELGCDLEKPASSPNP
jgi:hypothetical protein